MKIEKYIPEFLVEEKSIPWIIALFTLGVFIQKFIQGQHYFNNYIIFETSFHHLVAYKDLYLRYPDEYDDLFLYSPTFAFLMFPFAYLPMGLQLFLWCGINGLCIYLAIKWLPLETGRKRVLLLALLFIEYITAIQNVQVAPMVVSLIIFAFVSFEKKQVSKAAFFILLAAFIKIYAVAAAILFLMYPKRLKFIGMMLFWGIILMALPLLVVSFKQLIFLYESWYHLTISVHQSEQAGNNPNILIPLSVMMWLKTWFNFTPGTIYVQLIGTAILCIPFTRIKAYNNLKFRIFMLSSILIWAMIFNHIAESASYIVAVFGVCIWFVEEEKNKLTITLMVIAFILTIMSASDLFPRPIRIHYVIPYVLKAVPCILIWGYLQYRLNMGRFALSSGTVKG